MASTFGKWKSFPEIFFKFLFCFFDVSHEQTRRPSVLHVDRGPKNEAPVMPISSCPFSITFARKKLLSWGSKTQLCEFQCRGSGEKRKPLAKSNGTPENHSFPTLS